MSDYQGTIINVENEVNSGDLDNSLHIVNNKHKQKVEGQDAVEKVHPYRSTAVQ